MEIVSLNNERFLVLRKTKQVSNELLNKIKLNCNADIVLFNNSDNTNYFCQYIEDAKISEYFDNKLIMEKNDVVENENKTSMVEKSISANAEHIS